MKRELLHVSIRQNAVFIPAKERVGTPNQLTESTLALVANASKLGFGFGEDALRALNQANPKTKLDVLDVLKKVTGVDKNWTPLVKEWNIPTGETIKDHFITFFANLLGSKRSGPTLPCGHIIPVNTFPLERYNGCPFCGTPFNFGKIEVYGQGSKMKVLEVWDENNLKSFMLGLLASRTALDATQVDSLKTLLGHFELPNDVAIEMKETTMLVIDFLVDHNRDKEAQPLFKTPTDVLRYLWYSHTGFLQIVEPKTMVNRTAQNAGHIFPGADNSKGASVKSKEELKLKYTRKEGKRVAMWLNGLTLSSAKSCEIMHPKRGMWVRFIRALRLAEFSKRKGFENLADLLDMFYNQRYEVVQGRINAFRLKSDAEATFGLLKSRPGLFARSLFSNMLWFGADITLTHFREIMDQVPARVILTLNMYADRYFDKNAKRNVKPLGGTNKVIPVNQYLQLYSDDELKIMRDKVEDLCLDLIKRRFEATPCTNKTIFIEDSLYNIPLAIGDRSETVQDMPSALMGTRFPVEGSKVRLFMQWGLGLRAGHLDMDLSCNVAYEDRQDICSYSRLVIPGCKHSGDIIHIPAKVGTAEYIDVHVDALQAHGAKFVTFTCNAYSQGSITPQLVVGWMNSKYPMHISTRTGVAYDPSCVQHQVRITQGLTKGLVFGVLDVQKREIVWLEMSFSGQVVQNLNISGVEALLAKLESKMNIGALLEIKAQAQGLTSVSDKAEADEIYDFQWSLDSAKVTQLFVD